MEHAPVHIPQMPTESASSTAITSKLPTAYNALLIPNAPCASQDTPLSTTAPSAKLTALLQTASTALTVQQHVRLVLLDMISLITLAQVPSVLLLTALSARPSILAPHASQDLRLPITASHAFLHVPALFPTVSSALVEPALSAKLIMS